MGCVVNGPGEAREADFGVAVGKNGAVLFRKGEVVKKITKDDILKVLLEELSVYNK
jgi:(E)-4-hydroxy-3-methylbut-2-enyl-diphosphate synthase